MQTEVFGLVSPICFVVNILTEFDRRATFEQLDRQKLVISSLV